MVLNPKSKVKNQKWLPALGLLFLIIIISARADNVPGLVNYQGVLTDASGGALAGSRTVAFSLYDAPTGGAALWGPQTFTNVTLVQGRFNVILGPFDASNRKLEEAFHANTRFLATSVDGCAELAPRQQVLSAPFALQAARADRADLVSHGQIEGTPVGQTEPAAGKFTVVESAGVRLNGNVISATSTNNANGDLEIAPVGTGRVVLRKTFGQWTHTGYQVNVTYRAQNDLFVVFSCYGTDYGDFSAYSDANSTPTNRVGWGQYDNDNFRSSSATFPVRKGDYWRITYGGNAPNVVVYATMAFGGP